MADDDPRNRWLDFSKVLVWCRCVRVISVDELGQQEIEEGGGRFPEEENRLCRQGGLLNQRQRHQA